MDANKKTELSQTQVTMLIEQWQQIILLCDKRRMCMSNLPKAKLSRMADENQSPVP